MSTESCEISNNNFPLLRELLWIDKYVQSKINVLVSGKSFFYLPDKKYRPTELDIFKYILIDMEEFD
jgi:hypothetical protein